MKIKKLLIGFIALILVVGGIVFFIMSKQVNQLANQDFGMIDVADLPDGIYQGSVSALLVSANVEVAVYDGHIKEVKLIEHNHGKDHGAEALCEKIVSANSPNVDIISGATASSIVVKSAVLDALKRGITP
ncbi:MAG: FMN-binding protein [Christensenellaceae bacterium]|nr:FMN-binding protein [Christensenellaceae bacterium]